MGADSEQFILSRQVQIGSGKPKLGTGELGMRERREDGDGQPEASAWRASHSAAKHLNPACRLMFPLGIEAKGSRQRGRPGGVGPAEIRYYAASERPTAEDAE